MPVYICKIVGHRWEDFKKLLNPKDRPLLSSPFVVSIVSTETAIGEKISIITPLRMEPKDYEKNYYLLTKVKDKQWVPDNPEYVLYSSLDKAWVFYNARERVNLIRENFMSLDSPNLQRLVFLLSEITETIKILYQKRIYGKIKLSSLEEINNQIIKTNKIVKLGLSSGWEGERKTAEKLATKEFLQIEKIFNQITETI